MSLAGESIAGCQEDAWMNLDAQYVCGFDSKTFRVQGLTYIFQSHASLYSVFKCAVQQLSSKLTTEELVTSKRMFIGGFSDAHRLQSSEIRCNAGMPKTWGVNSIDTKKPSPSRAVIARAPSPRCTSQNFLSQVAPLFQDAPS